MVRQFFEYAQTRSPDTARILRVNAYETATKVDDLHGAFDALFARVPDAFGLRDLRERERRAYTSLAGAIEFRTDPPVPTPVKSLRKSLRDVHAQRDTALRRRGRRGRSPTRAWCRPFRPTSSATDSRKPSSSRSPVSHPCDLGSCGLEQVLWELAELGEPTPTDGRPSEVWIALTYDGVRLEPGAIRLFSHQLDRFAREGTLNWESFGRHDPPT